MVFYPDPKHYGKGRLLGEGARTKWLKNEVDDRKWRMGLGEGLQAPFLYQVQVWGAL